MQTPPHMDAGLSLALAVIASSTTPVLLLDDTLTVIAASDSFSQTFEIASSVIAGRRLVTLGDGEWNIRQLAALLNATAAGHADIDAYEMDLIRTGSEPRHLVVNARKLEYGGGAATRLLLSIRDVTETRVAGRLKEVMLREMADIRRDKALLLQELQHRVANSLQIIASVLLQSARRVQSDETRSHLHEAHQRVMSVAAVQKQLAASSTGDVVLRSYFTALCESLAASMIRDRNQLSLTVATDESVISADVSISLGLIVTELVINALKHAFPGDRRGTICVSYRSDGATWLLSVTDDGVGMAKEGAGAKAGLGTSIVLALARQLEAEVRVTDNNPGTAVSVVRDHAAQPQEIKAPI